MSDNYMRESHGRQRASVLGRGNSKRRGPDWDKHDMVDIWEKPCHPSTGKQAGGEAEDPDRQEEVGQPGAGQLLLGGVQILY